MAIALPAAPQLIDVQKYIALIVPEHNNGTRTPPPVVPVVGSSRILESSDRAALTSLATIFASASPTERADVMSALANPSSLLLMHFDGPNNSTTFTDSSAYATSFAIDLGSPVISTTQSKFGGSSYRGNIASSLPSAPIGLMGTNAVYDVFESDFTVEFFAYFMNNFSSSAYISFGTAVPAAGAPFPFTAPHIDFVCDSVGNLICYFENSVGFNFAGNFSASALPANTWAHVAFVRHNNVLRCYLNGTASATLYTLPTTGFTGLVYANVGGSRCPNTERFTQGYMDELRFNRYAVYTTNFTPPSAPFIF